MGVATHCFTTFAGCPWDGSHFSTICGVLSSIKAVHMGTGTVRCRGRRRDCVSIYIRPGKGEQSTSRPKREDLMSARSPAFPARCRKCQ